MSEAAERASACLVQILPLRIVSEANRRDHWSVKAKRTQAHRLAVQNALAFRFNPGARLVAGHDVADLVVTMTRIAPRTLDDDNLASGFKAVRDGVALWLGIDDRSPLVRWVCEQRRGAKGEYAAEVRIAWTEPADSKEAQACPF